ncbi:MAG: hypothetical protein DMD49_11715 [Gemmatimonadetes bacterium]|nr:MAG: hypothetical protein DMD49_11715 [Gemmatimonadota bacterium]
MERPSNWRSAVGALFSCWNRARPSRSSPIGSGWWQTYRRKGTRGLDAKPTPGRPPRLSTGQKRQLVKLLTRGALHAGYRTDLWTLPRVTELIHQQFGVRYHPAHVWKVLTTLGWSCQKPERRAVERDEVAIARWKRDEWPRIKKRRATWRPSRVRR